jgi:hypothetical protein
MGAPRSRWVRVTLYGIGGLGTAAILARLFHPHYLPLCNRINAQPGLECSPIPLQSMIGFFFIGLGLASMVIVPIVASVVHLVRNGANWEIARGTETTQSTLPILVGLIYLVAGAAIALDAY